MSAKFPCGGGAGSFLAGSLKEMIVNTCNLPSAHFSPRNQFLLVSIFTSLYSKMLISNAVPVPTGKTGRGSSTGSVSAWHASGPEFDPRVRHILSWRLGHEKISTAILPLPLIQEEQLSVNGERMCTKYW